MKRNLLTKFAWVLFGLLVLTIGSDRAFSIDPPETNDVELLDPESIPDEIKEIKIPTGNKVRTDRNFRDEKYQWLLRQTMAAFEKTGGEKAKGLTREKAVDYLQFICRQGVKVLSKPEEEEMRQKSRAMLDAGCRNPVIQLWCANSIWEVNPDEGIKLFKQILPLFKKEGIPKIFTFYTARGLVRATNLKNNWEARLNEYKQLAPDSLLQSVVAGEFKTDEMAIAYRLFDDVIDESSDREEWVRVYQEALKLKHVDPWLMLMLEGTAELSQGWMARGSGFADTVTQTGWREFKLHLDNARDAWTRAWEMHPNRPEAAARLIEVSMGLNNDQEILWFNHAVAAQVDYATAYDMLLWALRPRWGGSYEAMLGLGLVCMASGRTREGLPLVLFKVMADIAEDCPAVERREFYHIAGIHKKLVEVLEMQLDEPAFAPEREGLLAQRGLLELVCGDYGKAKKLLRDVDRKADRSFPLLYTRASLDERPWERIDAEVRLFTGPQKKKALQARQLEHEKKCTEARDLYIQLMAELAADKAIHGYLRDRAALAWLLALKQPIVMRKWTSGLLLDGAVYANNLEVAQFLVTNGADVNATTAYGTTALYRAVAKKNRPIAQLLLDRGANPNLAESQEGYTPLLYACDEDVPMMQLLLKHGANPERHSLKGYTPLAIAIKAGRLDAVKVLLDGGADLNMKVFYGYTPLHLAANLKKIEMAKLLIERGAKLDIEDDYGMRPLHHALYQKDRAMVELLIAHGTDLYKKDRSQRAPLCVAVQQCPLDLIQTLVAAGGAKQIKIANMISIAKQSKREAAIIDYLDTLNQDSATTTTR